MKIEYQPMEQIKDPEVNQHIYGQMIFKKGTKNTQWGKEVSSTNGVGKTGYPYVK